jgi:Sugar-transfer associated ATP-grasp
MLSLKQIKIVIKKFLPASWIDKLRFFLQLDRSHVPLPWFKMKREASVLNCIHQLALKLERKKPTLWVTAMFMLVWPILSCLQATFFVYRYGIVVKQRYHSSLWSQWKQLIYLANIYNFAPRSYYKFRLWEVTNRGKANLYIQRHEIGPLLRWLNRKIDRRQIDDKNCFFVNCQAHNLPTAPIIAMFDQSGVEKWYGNSSSFPHLDLFIKRTDLYCGIDAERWEYVTTSNKWKHGDSMLDHTELVHYCKQRSREACQIVQPRLKNHPSVEHFSQGGLCTLRVVTYRLPQKPPVLLLSAWRMPVGMAAVDNFAAGGLAAGISDTGELGLAVNKDIRAGILTHHPDTRAQITGEQLPCWRQMVDLALLAHERFGEPCFVGWDVAQTTNGLILLEGNTTWCVDLAQMPPYNKPLGETSFNKVFATVAEGSAMWERLQK